MENNGPIRCFFFDVGNVLLSHRNAQSKFLQKLAWKLKMPFEHMGFIYKEGIKECWDEFECGKVLPLEMYHRCLDAMKKRLPVREREAFSGVFTYGYFRESFGNVFRPMPRTIQFMGALKTSGCPIWLVSNNNPIHYEYCVRAIPNVFSRADGCVLSHEVGMRKPGAGIYRMALRWSGFSPENVLAIDDKPENIRTARSLGLNGHVFTNVHNLKSDLEKNFGFKFK